MTRRRVFSFAFALVLLGVLAEWAALRRAPLQEPVSALDIRLAVADLATGWVLAACGLVLWSRRPGNRVGPLLTATGATWFLGSIAESGVASYADAGALFVTLHRGPLVHAVLAYPDGRVRGRLALGVVAAAYGTAVVASVGEESVVAIVLAVLFLVVVVDRFARAAARQRVALRPALGAAAAIAAVLTAGSVLDLGGASAATDRAVLAAYEVALGGTALWFMVDLLRGRWTESAVTGLVVDLGGATSAPLRDRLAHALGDRSVVVGYRVPGRDGFVDDDGRAIELPAARSGREVTYVGGDDPVAVLVHDPGAVDDPALLEPVAAATRIAVSNVQLQAEIRQHLDELTLSRRRIVEAGDAQRSRLERQLRDGPQARLATVAELLERAPSDVAGAFTDILDETLAEVARAREELREFARGIHPPVLTDGGLDAALADLAERAPLPVELSLCGRRCASAVEAAAYFVCAEALANIGKYAEASSATITTAFDGGRLTVSIVDDGIGGADVEAGSGLRGLRDRVEALGGVLTVASPDGGGTRVHALLPAD